MHSVIIALIVSGGASAIAAAALSLQSSIDDHPLSRLFARQGGSGGIDPSTIPSQCQSGCGPIVADLQRCSSNSCLCTNNVRDDFSGCMNCLITASNGNPQAVTAAKSAASQYENACNSAGLPVSSITFSSASGAGASTPPAASPTGLGPAQPVGTASGAGPISITSAGSPAATTASPKSAAARGAPVHVVGLSLVAIMALSASSALVI